MAKKEISQFRNVYCDESCHLLQDKIPIMGFGAIIVPKENVRRHSLGLRDIKRQHNCNGELKWTKVSKKNIGFYIDLVNYFFSQVDLGFRALVVHNKSRLNHSAFNHGSHDEFYYKMYYQLIKTIADQKPGSALKIYLDIKDTKGAIRIHKLGEVLANSLHDFEHQQIVGVQEVRSHESEMVQLSDFILGAVSYCNRRLNDNHAKVAIIKRIEELSGYSLQRSTEPWETKFNLFHFFPRKEIPHA